MSKTLKLIGVIVFLGFVTAYSEEAQKTLQWEMLPKIELEERCEHSSILYDDKLIVWGGYGAEGKHFSDGAMLDLKTMRWKKFPEVGLAERRYNTAIVYKDKLIIWGGTNKIRDYFSDGAILDLKEMKWKELPETELVGRIRHTSVLYTASKRTAVPSEQCNDKLIIWGGFGADGSYSDGAMLDLKEMKWEKLPETKLKGRTFHVSILYNDKLIIWGGGGDDVVGSGYYSDGAMLDLKEMKWKDFPKTDLVGRDFAGAVVNNDKLFIWGGTAFADSFSDGAILDLKDMKWEKLPKVDLGERSGNSTIVYDNKLFIWGGAPGISNAGEFFSDGAMLNLKEMKWEKLSEAKLKGRMGHTSILYKDKLIIWGGTNKMENFSDGAMLDLNTIKWKDLPKTDIAGRSFHSSIVWNDKLIVWGGIGGVDNSEWYFSDGAMLDLKALTTEEVK